MRGQILSDLTAGKSISLQEVALPEIADNSFPAVLDAQRLTS